MKPFLSVILSWTPYTHLISQSDSQTCFAALRVFARALLLCSKELAKQDTLRECWSKPRNCYWHISTTNIRPKLTVIIKQQLRFHLYLRSEPWIKKVSRNVYMSLERHRPAGILQRKKFQFSKISGYLWTGPSSLIVWTSSSVILESFHRIISFKVNAKR